MMAFVRSEPYRMYLKCADGDDHLQTSLLTRSMMLSLYKYCLSLTGSKEDAEDLCQEVYVRILPHAADLSKSEGYSMEGYLIRSAHNVWVDSLRKEARRRELLGEIQEQYVCSHQELGDGLAVEEAFQVLLTQLTDWQRTIYILCELFSYKARETADLLDSTEGAVKAALRRAREVIAEERQRQLEADEPGVLMNPVSEEDAELLRDYLGAFRAGDTERIIQLGLGGAADVVMVTSQVLGLKMHSGTAPQLTTAWCDSLQLISRIEMVA
ncbi:RNA polymerase sigma factor [Paenibacillus shunpengii]|uniref:RNA polymerase sigma factor n=1 Tax=Paenibacillus shunpengii TaxID=2054424 RepID=A0ABW5SJY4_9BACL|nr:RNA polymerase sigma factor [Paenibacillus sp. PDC88]